MCTHKALQELLALGKQVKATGKLEEVTAMDADSVGTDEQVDMALDAGNTEPRPPNPKST